jgi:hypothetical protein
VVAGGLVVGGVALGTGPAEPSFGGMSEMGAASVERAAPAATTSTTASPTPVASPEAATPVPAAADDGAPAGGAASDGGTGGGCRSTYGGGCPPTSVPPPPLSEVARRVLETGSAVPDYPGRYQVDQATGQIVDTGNASLPNPPVSVEVAPTTVPPPPEIVITPSPTTPVP